MTNKTNKKTKLSKETLRRLGGASLAQVGGALLNNSFTNCTGCGCRTEMCPVTL